MFLIGYSKANMAAATPAVALVHMTRVPCTAFSRSRIDTCFNPDTLTVNSSARKCCICNGFRRIAQ